MRVRHPFLCLIGTAIFPFIFHPADAHAACVNPAGVEGEIIFNASADAFQGCTPGGWQAFNAFPDPCAAAEPAIGTGCQDGTIYAGRSPDGNLKMYTTPADGGGHSWNAGNSTNYVDVPGLANCNAASHPACRTGKANTPILAAADSQSGGGLEPHAAAVYCNNLEAHGYSDWYLPALNELGVLYMNRNAGLLAGTFNTTGTFPGSNYWSSTEYSNVGAMQINFGTGSGYPFNASTNVDKRWPFSVRCVRTNSIIVQGTFTVEDMGVSMPAGGTKWYGAVRGNNNLIYGIPRDSTNILIINPANDTATLSTMGATLTGGAKWHGGALGADGKIYTIPFSATDILIIDPATNSATRSSLGATIPGSGNKWEGAVLGPDNKIYAIPRNAASILIIDPATSSASLSTMGASLTGSAKWQNGVLGPDGKIYAIPRDSTDILIIDPAAGTATRSNMGATLTGTEKWSGGALGVDGKIYGIPRDATDILIIDPVAGTATRSNMGADLTGTAKWEGGFAASNGKIYGIPRDSTDILVIDPIAGAATRTTMGASFPGSLKWSPPVASHGNVYYSVPFDGDGVARFDLND